MLALNTNSSETIVLQFTFSVSHTDGSFTMVVSNSSCVPSENPIAAVLGYFNFFLFLLKMVNCLYLLESPRRGDSNENTQYTYIL